MEDFKETAHVIGKSTYTFLRKQLRRTSTGMRRSPKALRTYLTTGLLTTIPIAVTAWILIWFFNLVDGILRPVIEWGFARPMPGLGFAIIVVIILIIGAITSKVGGRRIFQFLEKLAVKIPLVGQLYVASKQILDSFTAKGKDSFTEVVFMEFPRRGVFSVGLVTNRVRDSSGKELLSVFVPTTPNPTNGFLQLVPEREVIHSEMSLDDAMKMIISAGKVSEKTLHELVASSNP